VIVADSHDVRAAWDRIAPGYDRTNTATQMHIARAALERAGLRRGMSFLDVACGSGALGIPAARLGARVTAVDLSPAMLGLLQARASREGLSIEARTMDGHALGFEDGSFDMTGSQFGVMVFPDMPRGLREMVRVTRPGGTVLVSAYGDPHRIDFLAFLVQAVRTVRPGFDGPPMDPLPLPLQLSDPDRLRREMAQAGLREVSVETLTEETAFADGAALWDWIVFSNPIVEDILGSLELKGSERRTVQEALGRLLQERQSGARPAKLTNPVNVGIGRK
jgi:ubiquinone/menaquinone biosynthesis C-methylase UbiE